jgi:hypothetical protein
MSRGKEPGLTIQGEDSAPPGGKHVLAERLAAEPVLTLPPDDVFATLSRIQEEGIHAQCVMLDPWYNKGVGGIREDYDEFVLGLLARAAACTDHIYLWGFPEIVARYVDQSPAPFQLIAWLTWYYKNNPSVIRGWRSSQMACLHFAKPEAKLYPEHFLNEVQLEKQREGKLRYMPGPTSVIEEPLLVGFVGRNEQTGHPAQKPERVFDVLLRMVTKPGDLVVDPMCGSGTTGAVAIARDLRAILCDESEEYVVMSRERIRRAQSPQASEAQGISALF